jgi:hypothetical protein
VIKINDHIRSIVTGAREQSTALAEINSAVNQMDQVTQQNAAMVEETNAATQGLSGEAVKLEGLVRASRPATPAITVRLRRLLRPHQPRSRPCPRHAHLAPRWLQHSVWVAAVRPQPPKRKSSGTSSDRDRNTLKNKAAGTNPAAFLQA